MPSSDVPGGHRAGRRVRFGGTVELHLHMGICMSFEAVASLDSTLGADTYRREFVGPSRFDSLTAFLASTDRHVELLQTERGLRTCMRDLRSQLAADDALHAEPRFAPLRHIEGDLGAREVVEIVLEEARAWQRKATSWTMNAYPEVAVTARSRADGSRRHRRSGTRRW